MASKSQIDMFVADILDVSPKGDIGTMESPIFALSVKSDAEIWRYENGDDYIQVSPSAIGRPTIFDKDLLMYCISQVVEGINRGRQVNKKVRITAYDYLRSTDRNTGGRDYDAMIKAAERLRGVTITTNVGDEGGRRAKVRGLIDNAEVVEKDGQGRMVNVDIELSEWIFEAAKNMQVLTYSRRYYSLRKPNERRMYEICRKFCGNSAKWKIGFEKLYNRFGSRASTRKFRQMLKAMVADNNIPDYNLEFDDQCLTVYFSPELPNDQGGAYNPEPVTEEIDFG